RSKRRSASLAGRRMRGPTESARDRLTGCHQCSDEARLSIQVPRLVNYQQLGIGPCLMQRDCIFHWTDKIQSAMDDEARHVGETLRIMQRATFWIEEETVVG